MIKQQQLQTTLDVLEEICTGLRSQRDQWLADRPSDPVSDAYEFGISGGSHRTPFDDDISEIEAAKLSVMGYMRKQGQQARTTAYRETVRVVPTGREAEHLHPGMTHPVAVLLVLVKDGDVLMEWRDDYIAGGGYAFPGGHFDATDGNTYVTVIRESFEELRIAPVGLLPLAPVQAGPYLNVAYMATQWAGIPPTSTLDAHHRLEWRDLREVVNDPRWPASQLIGRQVMAILNPGWR